MRTEGKSKSLTVAAWAITAAIVCGLIGALVGVLAVGRLEALPVHDNESMTVQIHHMVKQGIGLLTGLLAGSVTGAILGFVIGRLRRPSA